MINQLQLSVIFRDAQNPINIQFSKERTLAQFIDWIYDNFNQFLTSPNKQQITLFSEKKQLYFGYENKQLNQTLDQNYDTIKVMTLQEKENQNPNPLKSLFIKFNNSTFEINLELQLVKVSGLIQFLQEQVQKQNILVFHKTNCLNNSDPNLTLQQVGIVDKDELRVQEQVEVQVERQIQLIINIQDGNLKRVFKGEFSNANTLNDVAQTVMTYLGAQSQNATVSLQIGKDLYDAPVKREKTLLQLQIQNDQQILAKMMWIGG